MKSSPIKHLLPRTVRSAVVATTASVLALATVAAPAQAAEQGSVASGRAEGTAAGQVDYSIYLPPGYDTDSTRRYPTVYLLHGRGDTMAAWQRVTADLDTLIASGQIQPLIAVMPDAPWNDRGNWYTDSQYTGDATSGTGVAVETALAEDLVTDIDARFRTVDDRNARAVGGYSMGGAGALRFALAHQETFSAGIVLSPAVYVPQPPADSSVRDYGAFGVGDSLFDADRYAALSYQAALDGFDPELPVHLFIAVGDDEWANPDPAEAEHDLDFESARLYNTVRRAPGITAELRVRNGGHDWDVWQPAFREAIVDVAQRLRTESSGAWQAELFGSAEDDRAGGVVEMSDGGTALALNMGGEWDGYEPAGGMDVVVIRRDESGELWRHAVATAGNDRAYGLVNGNDGQLIVAGYSRGNLDDGAAADSDDAFVVGIGSDGQRAWTRQLGDPGTADRFYAASSDGAGGAYLAGYTGGSFDGGHNAGDKDAVLVHLNGDGEVLWNIQLGGTGEDKALAVTPVDGGVVVAGTTGSGLPGIEHRGAGDGWVARYSSEGQQVWIRSVASAENDLINGLVPLPDGTVLAVGHTKGAIGAQSLGDNDILVRAFDVNGTALWTTQTGSSTDDRGVTGVAGPDGGAIILATTYGAMGEARGGVDVVALRLGQDGEPGEIVQLGSAERDGTDEWDEANLLAAVGRSGTWLTGLTFGAPEGQINAGAGDVFLQRLPFDSGQAPDPTPTDAPSTPTSDESSGPTSGSGETAGSVGPGAENAPDATTSHQSTLPLTGYGPLAIGALALCFLTSGILLGLLRRRTASSIRR